MFFIVYIKSIYLQNDCMKWCTIKDPEFLMSNAKKRNINFKLNKESSVKSLTDN